MGSNLTPSDVQSTPRGPALLVYYGPAFLQGLGNDSPRQRLALLAEIYRGSRELWPLHVAHVSTSVIIRIDTIKGLACKEIDHEMKSGKVWVLVKHNDLEAFVELSSTSKLNKFIANHKAVHVLDFSPEGEGDRE